MDHHVCNMYDAEDGADGLWTCRHVSLGISVRWWLEKASNKCTYCGEASLGSINQPLSDVADSGQNNSVNKVTQKIPKACVPGASI